MAQCGRTWEKLARRLSVIDKVHFVGEVSAVDLPRFYASGDAFVLPSSARAEAFGKVLLEAMASGLPCVTTDVGTGTSFVVQDGVTGLVVPPCQPDVLADAINRLLVDPEMSKRMGEFGRKRAVDDFSITGMVSHVESIYRQVLAESQS
jgi:rhamnosyl/mannosyltransferase